MKKRMISIVLALCFVIGSLPISVFALGKEAAVQADSFPETQTAQEIWDGSVADSYAGGTGSSSDPYLISTGAQLARFASQVNSGAEVWKVYQLTNDIYLNDVSNVEAWDTTPPQNQWTPIGTSTNQFMGSFSGKGFCVYGLYISTSDNYQGLFGVGQNNAGIFDVGVDKSYIKGGSHVAAVCGQKLRGDISGNHDLYGCYSGATVIGQDAVGGIVGSAPGDMFGYTFRNCHNTGSVTGKNLVGGIVGYCDSGTVSSCYNVGNITGNDRVGGIAGKTIYGSYCWNVGKVYGGNCVAGIIGEAPFYGSSSSSISCSFNAGEISGRVHVAGIVGYSAVYSFMYNTSISNCYNIGEIKGESNYVAGIGPRCFKDWFSESDDMCVFTNCYNTGNIVSPNARFKGPIFSNGTRGASKNLFYLTGSCGENYKNPYSQVAEKSAEEMATGEFVTQLNAGGSAWKQDTEGYNDGYPILNGIDYSTYAKYAITEKEDVSFAESTYYIDVGETMTISAVIPQALNMGASDIDWTISNKTVAAISQEALVRDSEVQATAVLTGLSPGNTQITLVLSDGREATCRVVVSRKVDFDVNMYRADKLLDNNLPYKSGIKSMLELQTPCNILVPLLQESGFDDSAKAWKSLTAFFDTVDKPSNLKEVIVEKKDIYAAIILQMLEIDTSRDYGILDTFKSGIKEAKSWESEVRSILKAKYDIEFTTSEAFESMPLRVKEIVQECMKDIFKKKYPNITFLDDCFSHMGTFFDVVDDFSTYIERCATVVELANMNESLKTVVRTMYNKCPETNVDLKLALSDCKSIVDSSTNDLLMRMYNDGWSIIGVEIAERLIDELWKDIKKACNVGFPVLDIFLAAYKTGKFVSEKVFNADKLVEQYFKMLATLDVELLVKNVHTTLENQYLKRRSSENAATYLSSIDVMYTSRDEDCINVYDFIDELDSALINRIGDFFEKSGADARDSIKTSINSIQKSYVVSHETALTCWINHLEEDYPNTGLYEKYHALFSESENRIVSKKYVAACPVDLYVYDMDDNLVAYVVDNKPYCNGNITVILEDDTKTLYFYNDEEYRIEYVGNDKGSMDVQLTEFDSNSNGLRDVYFYDIPLNDGMTYNTDVNGRKLGEISYSIQNTDGSSIVPNLDTYQPKAERQTIKLVNGSVIVDGELFLETKAYPDEQFEIYAYVPEGYEFVGWTSSIGTDVFSDIGSYSTTLRVPSTDVTIEAVLKKTRSFITIDPTGGTCDKARMVTNVEGKLPSFPSPTRPGYTFLGWFTSPTGGTQVTTDTVFTQDTTIYAHWQKNSSGGISGGYPSVSFYNVGIEKAEHGTVTSKPSSIYSGGTVTLTATPDENYRLDSITVTDSQGKEIEVTENGGKFTFTMPNYNVTVKAVFVPVQTATPTPTPTPTPVPTQEPTPTPAPTAEPWKNPFPDVKDTEWYIKAVEFVCTEGLMTGYANGNFGPNDQITRAQFAQLFYNKEGRPGAEAGQFTDVKPGQWYADAVNWAAKKNVVNGVGGGKFAPNEPITREQMATMLWRYAGSPKPEKSSLNFNDAGKVSDYAREAMCWATENGVMNGKGGGTLDPLGTAKRCEVAQMLMNYLTS